MPFKGRRIIRCIWRIQATIYMLAGPDRRITTTPSELVKVPTTKVLRLKAPSSRPLFAASPRVREWLQAHPIHGLIAEEVAKTHPDLVAHSVDGQIETVKYQVLDSMLLNGVQRQEKIINAQAKEIELPEEGPAKLRPLRGGVNRRKAEQHYGTIELISSSILDGTEERKARRHLRPPAPCRPRSLPAT
jgi:hypothetical protein